MLILLHVLFYISITQAKISIKYGGVAPISPGDIGMIFYFTVVNKDPCSYTVFVEMEKCCEKMKKDGMECGFMQLIGGSMGVLNPHSSKNITMLYPNMYLLNRIGKCHILITTINEQKQTFKTTHTIPFNTAKTITPTFKDLKVCSSQDLDPFDNCQPVNCQMKYLGCRSYFDQKQKTCVKIPHCIADPKSDLPDLVYIPLSNKCRNLRQTISKSDLKQLEQGVMVGKTWEKMGDFPIVSANFRCHHGVIDNKTGFCICNDGWTSVPFTKDNYEPTLSLYHMCNIRVGSWHEMNEEKFKMTMLIISLCAVSTTIIILLVAFCLNILYNCVKTFDNRNGEGCRRNFISSGELSKWGKSSEETTCCPESCPVIKKVGFKPSYSSTN